MSTASVARVAAAAPVPPPFPDADSRAWLAALAADGPAREAAAVRLHAMLLRAARFEVRRRGVRADADVLATQAADDALAAILGKLDTYRGESRFTTWAYKFAILQAATEVRRQAWAAREVSLDDIDIWSDASPSPEQHAEAADLAAAVGQAMHVALTTYQRKIAVALLVDQVPIDVLADRLGTTRGALYKTLHEARSRLRAHLTAAGHLAPTTPAAGTR